MYKTAIVICKDDVFLYNNLFTHAHKAVSYKGDKKTNKQTNSSGF
jgi:hypothetical protein